MKRPCKSSNPANSGSRNRWRDLLLRTSRADRTAIELFRRGAKTLALQLPFSAQAFTAMRAVSYSGRLDEMTT